MKYLVQVDAVGEVHGALAVEAESSEAALKKAELLAEKDAYWGRPKNVRVVLTKHPAPLEPPK